jgi:hypothetical protein
MLPISSPSLDPGFLLISIFIHIHIVVASGNVHVGDEVEFLPASFSFTPRPPQNESDDEIHVAVAPFFFPNQNQAQPRGSH